MWRRKTSKSKEDLQISSPLILNSQSQMSGDFIIHTDVKIDGYVQGNVTTTQSVIIGEKGYLKGNLKCKVLIVFGSFEGVSEAKESACLQSVANFKGKLTAPIVSIFAGCRINAVINHDGELDDYNETPDQDRPVSAKGRSTDNDPGGKTGPNPGKGGSFLFNNLNK